MQVEKYAMILEAREPIAHHAETVGNESIVMRRKVRMPDGRWAHVPIITGDTMRHQLREAAAYATLDAAGLLKDSPRLSEGALRLLFSGGVLGGKGAGGGSALKLDDYRRLVDLFPPLSLLGGATEGRIIPGRLVCGEALLICRETAHLIPDWVLELAGSGTVPPQDEATVTLTPERRAELAARLDTCRSHVETQTRVRMDPMLVPEKRLLLADEERARVEGRLLTSETARAEGDMVAADESKSAMLPRSFERVCSGSLFFWEVSARCYSELDRACFLTMLAWATYDMRVGGKRGTGHGALRVFATAQGKVPRPADAVGAINPNGLATPAAQVFREHVRQRADALREWLAKVDA